MADPEPSAEEALTKEEIQSTSETSPAGEKRKNAFTTLMAPKKKQPPAVAPARSAGGSPFKDRMGLGAYLGDPSAFSASVVIAHTPDFVVLHDKFPKATVHALI
ncbi:hypothetical protein LLEC1_00782, partial [Akanthomyces lecanii]